MVRIPTFFYNLESSLVHAVTILANRTEKVYPIKDKSYGSKKYKREGYQTLENKSLKWYPTEHSYEFGGRGVLVKSRKRQLVGYIYKSWLPLQKG